MNNPFLVDEKGAPIAFLCNGQKPCHTHPNCGITHTFGKCRRTLDPKYAAPPKKEKK